MPVNAFIFKLLLLSIPGFIAFILFRKIAVYRRTSKGQFGFMEAFTVIIYSLVCCIVYDLSIMIINKVLGTGYTATLSKLINVEMYKAEELAFLCIIAIVLGIVMSIFETKKIINGIAIKLRISKYYGDTDVWTSFCSNKNTNWIYVRDNKLKLIYFGDLEHYSNSGEERELLLTEVKVYTENGDFCYNSPMLYVCRQSYDITLEIPSYGEGEKDGKVNDKEI